MSNWFFINALIKRYAKKNDYYMFYLHPFELSKEKLPKLGKLKFYDKMYLKKGNLLYRYKIENIIKILKKTGYKFTTFEKLVNE